jgi:hypothetical protein
MSGADVAAAAGSGNNASEFVSLNGPNECILARY